MRVWVVTTGEYSAYGVHSVWDTEIAARTFAERLPDGNVEAGESLVEEPRGFDVRRALPRPIVIEERRQYLYSNGEGPDYHKPYNRQATSVETWAGERPQDEVPVRVRRWIGPSDTHGTYTTIQVEVFGTDKERVDKVFSEMVARTRAEFDLLIARADAVGHLIQEETDDIGVVTPDGE